MAATRNRVSLRETDSIPTPVGAAAERAIDEAVREAARDARRLHKALGNPMATWKDGQVVWIQPEDIAIDMDPDAGEALDT